MIYGGSGERPGPALSLKQFLHATASVAGCTCHSVLRAGSEYPLNAGLLDRLRAIVSLHAREPDTHRRWGYGLTRRQFPAARQEGEAARNRQSRDDR